MQNMRNKSKCRGEDSTVSTQKNIWSRLKGQKRLSLSRALRMEEGKQTAC